jgi:hypothetical protein
MGSGQHYKSSWRSKSSTVDKPWGSETSWHAIGTISGKCLKISKGNRTSLKYYRLKDEVLFLYKGKILVEHGCEGTLENPEKFPFQQSILLPGELINVQSCCPYRIEALEDSEVIEIGSRESQQAVRIADDYGRESSQPVSNLLKNIGEKDGSS